MRGFGVPGFAALLILAGFGAPAAIGQVLLKVHLKNASKSRLEVCINGNYQGYVVAGKTMHTVREKFVTRDSGRGQPGGGKATGNGIQAGMEGKEDFSLFAWSIAKDGSITYFRSTLPGCLKEIAVVCGSEQLPSELEVLNSTRILNGSARCEDAERKIESAFELFQGRYKNDEMSADLKLQDGLVRGTISKGRERHSVRGRLSEGQVLFEIPEGEKTVQVTATATATTLTLVDGDGVSFELQKEQLPQVMPGKVDFNPIHRIDELGMELVFLRPGKFIMGAESEREIERPVHKVELRLGYYLGRTEVTQAQFREIMGTAPWSGQAHTINRGDAAASYVTWDEAVDYCRRLNDRDRQRPKGYDYRLPTEAEWEYACRAGTTGDFSCSEADLNEYAVFSNPKQLISSAQRVASRQANPWGLYDMHGNVWEWCQDWLGYYDAGIVVDPVGPPVGDDRIFRGGGWRIQPKDLRSAYRFGNVPGTRNFEVGFRVALAPTSAR